MQDALGNYICEVCKKKITHGRQRKTRKFCSLRCKDIQRNEDRKSNRVYNRECGWCGINFLTNTRHKMHCSPLCSRNMRRFRAGGRFQSIVNHFKELNMVYNLNIPELHQDRHITHKIFD